MKYKKLAIALLLIILVVLSRFIGIDNYINFQILKDNREYFLDIVRQYYWFSVFLYIVAYVVVAALSLPIAVPLTILGGFIFDVLPATLYVNIGATLGSAMAFLAVRYFVGSQIQKAYAKHLIAFNKNIDRYGSIYLLLARFIVLIPFFLVNILAALTNISLKTFIWTTSLGIIPGTLVYAYAGKNILTINSPQEIFSPKIILIFVILIFFGFSSLLFKKMKFLKNKEA